MKHNTFRGLRSGPSAPGIQGAQAALGAQWEPGGDKPDRWTGTKTDYRGLKICWPCWNGYHLMPKTTEKGKATGRRYCNCDRGECECPCRNMLQDEEEQARRHKEQRAANKASQTSFPGMGGRK